jgi:4-hydroxy-2-oxoheptanedioate aldolase
MSDKRTLKQRIHDGEVINIAFASLNMSKDKLEDLLSKDTYDLIGVDIQHNPYTEERVVAFCEVANDLGVPVQLRIKHPRQAYLVGNYLDLGLLSVVVPLVEDETTVDEAIEAFYYPPVGRRSWGPRWSYGFNDIQDRLKYAEWWNNNGVLTLQLESVKAMTNVRKLAKPGVDMFVFGAMDLSFDLERHPESPFDSVEDCCCHVVEQVKDLDVRVGVGNVPFARFG